MSEIIQERELFLGTRALRDSDESTTRHCFWYIPKRYIMVALCALSVLISYADRSNMSIAVIPMSKELEWSQTRQGLVLSAFFYGYIGTQIAGGWLADQFGGKPVLAGGAFLWSLFTVLTPWAAMTRFELLIVCRILLGAGEGVAFPAIHALLSKWIPKQERSRAVATVTAASYLGAVLALSLSPALSHWGWPSIFYVFGLMGIVWLFPWFWLASSRPEQCQSISRQERVWIQGFQRRSSGDLNSSMEETLNEDSNEPYIPVRQPSVEGIHALDDARSFHSQTQLNPIPTSPTIPWRMILSRREVWAILLNHFANSWGFYILLSWLPSYYQDVFGVDLHTLGFASLLPYVVQGSVGLASGALGDYLINKRKWRTWTVRAVAQCSGMLGAAFFLLVAAYAAKDIYQGMICISLALGINALTLIGVSMSQLDIAPKYAGIIFGMGNTAATLPGIVGVTVTGWLLESLGKTTAWPVIFCLAAVIYVLGALIWLLWSGGDEIILH